MALIKSISGIRGTIGGKVGETLNPIDIAKFTSAYATFIRRNNKFSTNKIVVGRDARISGEMVRSIVCGTLIGIGYDVIDIGLATTPTTELATTMLKADGGIIITASHNPSQWNALKLLNNKGEFLTASDGEEVLRIAENEDFEFADVDRLGYYSINNNLDELHIESVLALELVDADAIKNAKFKVAVDVVNSVGGIILPKLFDKLGVEYNILFGEPTGDFAHNPEPLEQNLSAIMQEMKTGKYDLGIVVDPDVDRLALIMENGRMFGEEYTLVSVADYILSKKNGNTVSNLSSTRALRDITERNGGKYFASAVGEVNVTTLMKEVGAVIGGEGNGGVIYPESHFGRDALVGIALFLTQLAQKNCKVSELRASYPSYYMAKNRLNLSPDTDIDTILNNIKNAYKDEKINDIDGIKIDFKDKWVHLRKSNTEPIIRIYSEATSKEEAESIAEEIKTLALSISNN